MLSTFLFIFFFSFSISFFLRDHNRNKAVQLFCAIPVAIDFLIVFRNSITTINKFFVYLYDDKINLPTYLPKTDTTLSREYWILKQKQQTPSHTWNIKEQCKAYNPTLKKYNICLNEKLAIIDDPDKNLLNRGQK